MNLRVITFTVILTVVHCAPNDEVAAELFINRSSAKLYDIVNVVNYNNFLRSFSDEEALATYEAHADPEIKRLYEETIENTDEVFSTFLNYSGRVGEFKYDKFKNLTVKQGIQNMHLLTAYVTFVKEATDLTDSLKSVRALRVCPFREKSECDVHFVDITKIIQETNDPEELKYYWKEWRYVNQPLMKETLKIFLRHIAKTSERWNVTPSTFFFSEVLDESIIDDMEKVVKEMEPIYREFHAFVRSVLIKDYGADVIPATGFIPAHLFEKILKDLWTKNEMWNALDQTNLTAHGVLEFSNNFFIDMGFDELPKEFWAHRISQENSSNCQPLAIDFGPKSFLTYCNEVNMRIFLKTRYQMAKIYSANQKKDLPFAYFSSMHFNNAVAFATLLAAQTTKHMNSLGIINGTDYASEHVGKERIKHLGIESILNIPIDYIHARVLNDLITGNVELDKINAHYWALMKKYAGVTPPVSVKEDDINFPYDLYDKIYRNVPMIKFMVKVTGHQIYESLCDLAKHDDIELNKCDFSKSLEAGKALKEMMSTGCKKPWREVLSIVTGNTDGMSAAPIKNYYSSLYNWIKEQNTKSAIRVGWD